MTNSIPYETLMAARLEASFSNAAFVMRKAAEAMDDFAFAAHQALKTDEFKRGNDAAIAALAKAKMPRP